MLFHSANFIFIFLPIALCGYYLLGEKQASWARLWLLLFSFLFYFMGERANLPLLFFSIMFNYSLGTIFSRNDDNKKKPALLILGIVLNLSILIFFKSGASFKSEYTSSGFVDLCVPLGMSFITLQQIAFLVDTYQNKIRNVSIIEYALFVSFFPQLIAGPIVRFQEIVPQLKKISNYKFQFENLIIGFVIFLFGVAKKIICADRVAIISNAVAHNIASGEVFEFWEAWIGVTAFAIQLYFDFSSYSDMAVGAARLFGIKLPINFNSPFRANGVMELSTRWHITLYRYLSDYIAKPLIAQLIKLPFKKKITGVRFAVVISTFLIFFLSGLWHGFSFNFILWGLTTAFLAVTGYLWKEYCRERKVDFGKLKNGIGYFKKTTFVLLILAFGVFFRLQNVEQMQSLMTSLIGLNGFSLPVSLKPYMYWLEKVGVVFRGVFQKTGLEGGILGDIWLIIIPMVILAFMPNVYELMSDYDPAIGTDRIIQPKSLKWKPNKAWAFILALLTVAIICCSVNDNYQIGSYEYFNF